MVAAVGRSGTSSAGGSLLQALDKGLPTVGQRTGYREVPIIRIFEDQKTISSTTALSPSFHEKPFFSRTLRIPRRLAYISHRIHPD